MSEKSEALQAVLDRVNSYQDGAPEGTVERELREALSEADLELTDDQIAKVASTIEDGDGPVSAADVLGE